MHVRPQPCPACPYKKCVASGVWAAEEYEKLVEYDAPTSSQPPIPFMCHDSDRSVLDTLCAGWFHCHNSRGREFELLAVRLAEAFGKLDPSTIEDPEPELFASGVEAALHGVREIAAPSDQAQRTIDALLIKHGADLKTLDD